MIMVGHMFQELDILQKLFQWLRETHLKLHPKKYQFLQDIRYLGHTVSAEGITTDPRKLKAVWVWSAPRDEGKLRSFLGLCTYYRQFISVFVNTAQPLTILR
jgi:hypothetical protein